MAALALPSRASGAASEAGAEDVSARPARPVIPNETEMRRRIRQSHPRILFRDEDLRAIRRRSNEPLIRACLDPILAAAKTALANEPPKIEVPTDFFPTYRAESAAAVKRNDEILRPVAAAESLSSTGALAYQLTGETRYRDGARRALLALAGIDLRSTAYAVTHAFHGVVSALAMGLDYLWDELPENERETVIAALVGRAREFHPLSVQVALRNPQDFHAFMYGPGDMGPAALALYHHIPDAGGWLRDIITFLTDVWPFYGGDDGGWGQGFGYGEHHQIQRLMQMIDAATGVRLSDTPWARNNGRFFLYFQPPYSRAPTFGDAGFWRPPGLHRQMMLGYALSHQDPYYAWYAEQIRDGFTHYPDYLLSMLASATSLPKASPPRDLPQALHMRDIGWVAMHSNLADGRRNVMVQFKSSRFGSFNHSHADQNSFLLEAFGQPLLIDSGYYPWYGSEHDLTWTRQTRAHNALLINGKGQGVWNEQAKGRILAFATSRDFDYTAGDATAAYRAPSIWGAPVALCAASESVVRVVRHLVYARPGTIVVLDDVESEQPAEIAFLLHAPCPFTLDEAGPTATIINGAAAARVHLPWPGRAALSQTDQFSAPPERGEARKQWHLTCRFGPTTRRRQILTVICVSRADDTERSPVPTVQLMQDAIGATIGDVEVRFSTAPGPVRVTCRKVGAGREPIWFSWDGPEGA